MNSHHPQPVAPKPVPVQPKQVDPIYSQHPIDSGTVPVDDLQKVEELVEEALATEAMQSRYYDLTGFDKAMRLHTLRFIGELVLCGACWYSLGSVSLGLHSVNSWLGKAVYTITFAPITVGIASTLLLIYHWYRGKSLVRLTQIVTTYLIIQSFIRLP